MRTSDVTQEIQKVIRDLVESYVLEPEELIIDVEEHPARVNWTFKGSPADTPLLVGTGGSHVKALGFIIRESGRAAGKFHKFELLDPNPGVAEDFEQRRPASTYDCDPAMHLLDRVLAVLGIGEFKLEYRSLGRGQDGWLRNELWIWVRGEDDYKMLMIAPSTRDPMTAAQALGTLFRAAAKKTGVLTNIQVKKA